MRVFASEGARAVRSLGLAVVLLSALEGSAEADTPPSIWDRAKDPSVSESYRLHVEVQRRLAQRDRFDPGTSESNLLRVRTMLEHFSAETSPDPRLRFDLGNVYFELGQHEKATRVLLGVLAEFPDHPAAEDGWLTLAFACGHTGDHECEKKGYVRYLSLQTEELSKGGRSLATPILNLAETEMHLGNLKEAVEGYREALRIAGRVPSRDNTPLAVWGLAVALDRSGDRTSAEKEARFARELERSIGMPNLLHTTNVFFVPAYEIHWYEGLGASAQARQASTPSETVRLWRMAEHSFASYVRAAEPVKDRWLELAKIRLLAVKGEREKAEKKYGKEPRREPEDDERELAP